MINFDAPGDRDAYVHRVGRSGRAGRDGAGISFVMPDQDAEMRRIAACLGLVSEFDRGRSAHHRPSGSHERTHGRRGGGGGRRRPRRRASGGGAR